MKLGEAPAPELQPGSIRIRVAATAVNRADLLQRQGLYPVPPGASPILGLECAGEVVEVAPDVEGWKIGDRAMALLAGGGYAEEVVVPAVCAMQVPERLSIEEGRRGSRRCSSRFISTSFNWRHCPTADRRWSTAVEAGSELRRSSSSRRSGARSS